VDLDVADALLEQALVQDPGYAQAWEMRSALQTLMVSYGYSTLSIEQADRTGVEFAERALRIEPNSAMALAVIARTRSGAAENLRSKEDLTEIFALFGRALEINPHNASALNWRGLHYLLAENHFLVPAQLGKDEESRDAFIEALNISTTKPQFAPFASLARLGEEIVFKAITNDDSVLQGWRRHDELWNAYRNPGQDYKELIESIRQHEESNGVINQDEFEYLVHPLGNDWRTPSILILWDDWTHLRKLNRNYML